MAGSVRTRLRQWFWRRVQARLVRADPSMLCGWVGDVVTRRASSLPPADALRLLLALETRLHERMDEAATRLDGGVHAKHRLTGYHDFFVARIAPRERVLDIGCGIGALARDVAERSAAEVVAVDRHGPSIETARQHFAHPRVTCAVADATRDLPEGRFDVVILSNVLEHISDRVGLLRRVREATGCRRFLIRVPLLERDWLVAARRDLGLDSRLDPTHETEYSVDSFAREMSDAGLTVREAQIRWGEIWAVCVRGGPPSDGGPAKRPDSRDPVFPMAGRP